jgi:hypothetical protein
MSGFLAGVASRMSSVMKAAALDGLGAEVGEELGDGMSSWPHACRRGEETAGVVALFILEEVFIPFNCGFDCGDPFAFVFFALDALASEVVEGPAAGSAEDCRLVEFFCGDDVSASWPTRLLFESLFAVSSLILGPEPGDPNAGEWYRLRRALPAPCHLYDPLGFLDSILVGVFGAAVEVGERVGEEAVGKSDPMAGEPARDGLFEKRNGC